MKSSVRRYAAHFVYIAGVGFVRRQVVEVAGGRVSCVGLLEGEPENTEWIPNGIIALLPPAMGDGWRDAFAGEDACPVWPVLPDGWSRNDFFSLQPCSLIPFDLIALKPVAGTRHKLLL